jgi:signal transduction histidine kinase
MAPSAFRTDSPPPPRVVMDDLLAELRRTSRIIGARDGVWRPIDAFVGLASAELTLASMLGRIVEVAREVIDAEYAALGVTVDGGGLRKFVHVGTDAATVERIGELPEGHGILEFLVREPDVLLLEDLSQHPASVGFAIHHPPISFLGVPITVRDTVCGSLYLSDSREGRGFTDEHVELVTALASVAGVAIDSAWLHDRSLRRERWLEATRDVAGALLRGTDTMQVLARVAACARDLADADVGTVAVVDDGDQQLTIVAADGRHAARLRGRQFSLESTIDGDVLASGRAATTDLTSDDRAGEPIAEVDGFGPAMCFPLVAHGRGVGTLTVARDKAGSPFDTDDIQFAEGFAEQAALALDYGRAQAERRLVAVYDERDRIGHDLQDLVIQRLFAAGLNLEGLVEWVVDDDIAERLDDAVDQIDAAIHDLRSSIFGLRARRDMGARLTTQIDEICRLAAAALGFAPACEIDPAADAAVTDELAPDLLAVVRETLTNVARHARASSVRLRLRVDDGICLEVADDGRGIAPGERLSGIANMRARAERLGGSMNTTKAAAGGTEIIWRVPSR